MPASKQYMDFLLQNCTEISKDPKAKQYLDAMMPIISMATTAVNPPEHIRLSGQSQAVHTAMEDALTLVYMAIYGIPVVPIEDTPESWVEVPDHPKIGSEVMVANGMAFTVNTIERHIMTAADSLVEVLRFNGDSKLAAMTYGCIIEDYNQLGDQKAQRSFAVNCFIQEFPFKVPMPIILEAYRENNIGLLSDITHRFGVIVDDLMSQAYSPAGTRLFPIVQPIDVHPFQTASMMTSIPTHDAPDAPSDEGDGDSGIHLLPKTGE